MDNPRKLELSDIIGMSQDEMEMHLIEQLAEQNDSQIQSDLLFDLVGRYVDLSKKLKEKIAEVELLSNVDTLTGLYTRIYLGNTFDREDRRYRRYDELFSIILVDIDHFKKVNDTYGHNAGDIVLKKFAEIMQLTTRELDVCARWGGEEFIVLAPKTTLETACKLAERIREAVAENSFEEVGRVTASFGVTTVVKGDSLVTCTSRADAALYEAKESGRNRVCFR